MGGVLLGTPEGSPWKFVNYLALLMKKIDVTGFFGVAELWTVVRMQYG